MVSVGKLGTPEEPVFIFDEGAPALYVDLITELEVDENDIVRISFGAATVRSKLGSPFGSGCRRIWPGSSAGG